MAAHQPFRRSQDDRRKIRGEPERSYDTMTGLLSIDGGIGVKKVRGYLNLLREERPISEALDPEKLVDFSMLPSVR